MGYLVAYVASYGFWIAAMSPDLSALFRGSDRWKLYVSVSWRLLSLNGAFNFIALWLHARDTAKCLQPDSLRVQLCPEKPEVKKIKKIDHSAYNRSMKGQVAQIQNENQRLWRELGLTYEQGVSGQLE